MDIRCARHMAGVVLLAALFSPTLIAHHSFAGRFDSNASMTIEGELIEIRWLNPHAFLKVRTTEIGKNDDEHTDFTLLVCL